MIRQLQIILISISFWGEGCFQMLGQDNDIVPTDLQEFVVESKNAWIENDRAVFVPTRREKNRANSVQTLLSAMNIPFVNVDGDVMKDLRGEEISVFINGSEATGVELSTFWPKDVIRVEYLSNPSDPKFKNKRAVVNFIVSVYSVGGVTKINTDQAFTPYSSYYNVSSKLVYKSMTYGASIFYRPTDYSYRDEEYEQYRNIWYNNRKYDTLTNENNGETKSNSHNINAAFNAIYLKQNKMRLVHTASISWNKSNDAHHQTDNWSPGIFSLNKSYNSQSWRYLSGGLSGMYDFMFTPNWQMSASWDYSYANINRELANQTSELPIIKNGTHEKVHAAGLSCNLSYIFNSYTSLTLFFNEKMNIYDIRYSGSYDNLSHQIQGTSQTGLSWWWQPVNKFSLNIMPAVTVNYRHIRGLDTDSECSPYLYIASNWYQSDRAYLNVYGAYAVSNGAASDVNEVLLRESELIWFKGNPELGNSHTMQIGVQQAWMPVSWFSPTLNVDYLYLKTPYYFYSAAPEDMGGLIREAFDDRPEKMWTFSLNLNANLLNRKLGINITPSMVLKNYGKGEGAVSFNRFNISGNVYYNIGNFNVNISYTGVEKTLAFGGYMMQYRPDKWGLGVTYGNGDFYASFKINNIFHKYRKQSHDYTFLDYTECITNYYPGREYSINLSYTFGYGKRVSKSIQIQNAESVQSGAAGS